MKKMQSETKKMSRTLQIVFQKYFFEINIPRSSDLVNCQVVATHVDIPITKKAEENEELVKVKNLLKWRKLFFYVMLDF